MNDLISILLPCYNAELSLQECLESILDQTYRNFEVIAVNDGSTDSSAAILSRYNSQDKRVRLFHLPKNSGIVEALNFGLAHCNGEWIARMDADDQMLPERLAIQLAYLKKNPDIDILGSRIKLFRFEGELTPGQLRYQNWSNSLLTDQQIKSNIFAESPIFHPTFFFKKHFIEEMGGYKDNPWPEDYDLLLRAFENNKIFGKIPEVLLKKGDHPLRLARTDSRCKRDAMFNAKAFYFTKNRSLWESYPQTFILGTGSAARMAFQALKKQNLKIDAFVDNQPLKSDKYFEGIPVISISKENAGEFFKKNIKSLFLIAIGNEEGIKLSEELLQKEGFQPGVQYFRFI